MAWFAVNFSSQIAILGYHQFLIYTHDKKQKNNFIFQFTFQRGGHCVDLLDVN